MTQITAAQVNDLRKQTGAGMMDCKKALVETNGDFEKAIDVLRKKGQKVAAKRADRETSEGVVLSITNDTNNMGGLICLNCETDFVAKNETFVDLARSILNKAINAESTSIDSIKDLSYDDSTTTINEKLVEQTGVIGEKIEISSYFFIKADYVASYIHPGNKLSSLVGFNIKSDGIMEIGKNIAMQIAAMNPIGIDESSVSKEVIEKEMEIGKDLARKEGKPEAMLEKIAQGRLKKFFKENTLLNQVYIKDSKLSILDYLKSEDENLIVSDFKRVQLG
ncbi:MAG: elongation factor Ts [Flavobacteriales bacterium]|jgi:elongation factor Ts|nr:elongation factor Ts [Flavobacteriales bacterium]|tara:strand:+ start:13323 stop:14159 length:837 start_codon:yes stop_codon:yes gene_type:complete